MSLRVRSTGRAILALALLSALAVPARAGDSKSQSTFGVNLLATSPPCPVKQLPTFESLVPIPGIIDPFAEETIPIFCDLQVTREGQGVRRAKGRYEADLIVVDNDTGEAESFRVGSGRFKTNSSGRAVFDFDIPADLFADGFESGDVSAWSYTRTDFTNRKRADNTQMGCGTSGNR